MTWLTRPNTRPPDIPKNPAANAFFLSPSELTFSADHPDTYVLARVYGYSPETDSARFYEVAGPFEESFAFTASECRDRLLPED